MDLKIFARPALRSQPRDPAQPFPDLCRAETVAGVVVVAGLLAVLIVVVEHGLRGFDWSALGLASLATLSVGLLSAGLLCLLRGRLSELGRATAAVASFCLLLVVTAVVSITGQWLFAVEAAGGLGAVVSLWVLLQHLIIAAVSAGLVLRSLYLEQSLRLQQQAELESRIQALQSRIRPHFLFNSMNMIASLIASDPDKAETVVEDLSDLFRHALTSNHTMVPLREELNLGRRYLALEQLRLGERLQAVWQIDDYGSGVQIPSLTLQPVLENAVYHGIQLIPEGGRITISVHRVGDWVQIAVENPRNPRMQHNKGNRMAVENVRTRLEAHFGPAATIEAEVREESYITHISYPVPEQPDNHESTDS